MRGGEEGICPKIMPITSDLTLPFPLVPTLHSWPPSLLPLVELFGLAEANFPVLTWYCTRECISIKRGKLNKRSKETDGMNSTNFWDSFCGCFLSFLGSCNSRLYWLSCHPCALCLLHVVLWDEVRDDAKNMSPLLCYTREAWHAFCLYVLFHFHCIVDLRLRMLCAGFEKLKNF